MLHSWMRDRRGQTEPLAALIAVAALAFAIGLYGLYVTDAMPGVGDRDVSQPTMDRIYDDLSSNGVFDAAAINGRSFDPGTTTVSLGTAIETTTLPPGRHVYVAVTTFDVDRSRQVFVAKTQFAPDGSTESIDRPPNPDRYTRPIPVRLGGGTVEGGRLIVEVWG